MIWKKKLCVLAALMTVLSGCSGTTKESVVPNQKQEIMEADKKNRNLPEIVCATFPEYDWVRNILGDQMEKFHVTLLVQNGMDLHSYQPSAEDMITISDSDVFIYTGGVSDSWVEDVRRTGQTEKQQILNLMEALGERIKTEEIAEGMEHTHGQEEETHIALDEHIWLSLKKAAVLVESLEQALVSFDEKNAAVFQKNADTYAAQLEELDRKYQAAVESAANKTVLFGDRFPFRYLTDDYGLEYYAAFTGCSAETEASFETITFLAGKLEELQLPAVLVIENSDQKLAETIINSTKERNAEILIMNSLQSVKREDMEAGVSYISVMEENLQVLKAALG